MAYVLKQEKPMAKRKNAMRNPLHNHPLMKRGGVHGKTNKAQRQQERQALKRQWRYAKIICGLFLHNATKQSVSEGNGLTSLA